MENKNIMIGRQQELALLQEIISSPKAELVAVYGRRRIGKTFLIDKSFDAKYDFYITGIYEGTRKEQRNKFFNFVIANLVLSFSVGQDGAQNYKKRP